MKQLITLLLFGILSLCAQISIAQLVIQNNATINTTGNTNIILNDINIQNNGIIQQGSGGKFIFSGTQNNTVSGTSEPHFSIVEVAKTSSGSLAISQNINVSDSVHFVSGNMQMDNAVLHLGNTGILSGENESSRLTSINNGSVQALSSASGSASMLNIGNLGAVITTSNALGNVEINRMHSATTNPDNPSFAGIERVYQIIPQNNSSLNATLRLYYLDTELNGKDESTLTLWKSEDGINWDSVGADSRNASNNYVEKTGINYFSYWTLTDGNTPLPLFIISFNAECNDNQVVLKWIITDEKNTSAFITEHSDDGKDWTSIEKIRYQHEMRNYSCNTNFKDGFYRLKIVNIDNSIQYSDIVKSNCNISENIVKVWPNPATDFVNIGYKTELEGSLQVEVSDAKGALMNVFSWSTSKGDNQYNINIAQLASGIYYITCRDSGNGINKTIKIVKQ